MSFVEIRSMTQLYALLKPDNFLQKTYKNSLTILQEEGFSLLNYKILKVNDELLMHMYAYDFSADLDFYSFNNKLFDFAPAIALILKKTGITQESFSIQKGSAIPEWITDKSCFRSKMQAQTRIFNRIHIPKTSDQAYTERTFVFGVDNIITSDSLLDEIKYSGYCETLKSPFQVWKYIKYRIACALNVPLDLKEFLKHSMQSDIKQENSLWQKLLSDKSDIIDQQIISLIVKMNEKSLNHLVYNLDYFWNCLELKHIFVSSEEKYYLSGYFLYPTK